MQKRGLRGLGLAMLLAVVMAGCGKSGRTTDRQFEKRLQEVERLCLEERYDEAVSVADEYWFSRPCSINDVMSGQNTFYKNLSENEIRFRLRLAAYTKTALIGSGNLVSRFFSYYRTPEIYNMMEDGLQGEYSIAGMLRQRVLDNPTAVYCMGINLIEKEGVSGEALSLMVPAMMACGQYNLAERYNRILAEVKGYKKEAFKYSSVLAFLRDSSVSSASEEVRALAEKITLYGKRGLTDYLADMGSLEADCRARWEQNPASRGVLEYILLFDLLRKNLEHASLLLPAYGPPSRPLQEMVCIMRREMYPIPDSVQAFLKDNPVEESVERNFRRFLHDFALLKRGQKTAEELNSEFGPTYAYHYYLFY